MKEISGHERPNIGVTFRLGDDLSHNVSNSDQADQEQRDAPDAPDKLHVYPPLPVELKQRLLS